MWMFSKLVAFLNLQLSRGSVAM